MKYRSLLLAALLLGVPSTVWAQATAPAASLPQNGLPFLTVPMNEIVGGPAASQIQDSSQVSTPVYASGGCTTTPAVTGNPFAFAFTNGASGCAGNTLTLTLPAAAHRWICGAHDVTAPTTTIVEQSGPAAASATSVVFTNYTRTTGAVLTWVASDVILITCNAF